MNPGPPQLEILSFVALKIELYYNEHKLGTGTAFLYDWKERRFLVTNWHNVTGRNPNSHKIIHKELGLPNELRVWVPTLSEGESGRLFHTVVRIGLYMDDDTARPKWMVHPVHAEQVDVAVLPWPNPDDIPGYGSLTVRNLDDAVPANSREINLHDLQVNPGMDAFVLGYPQTLSAGGLALWKRASVASEPTFDVDGLPKFYIDTASRSGMSGAPVFCYSLWRLLPDGRRETGYFRRFIGIYSGRILGEDDMAAQLGIVWKEQAIRDTIEALRIGDPSWDLSEKAP
jgi:hypothetical protein